MRAHTKHIFSLLLLFSLLLITTTSAVSQTFTQVYEAIPLDSVFAGQFGNGVAISGDYAIMASGNSADTTSSAYIFERDGLGNWAQKPKLVFSDKQGPTGGSGKPVSISGTTAIVGGGSGRAYIFERDGLGNWPQQQKISPSDYGQSFSYNVAISGNYLLVAAPREAMDENGMDSLVDAGAVYIFERNGGGVWVQTQKIVPSDRAAYDWFGWSVAISGNYAIISNMKNGGGYSYVGAGAYIFERNGSGVWVEKQKLLSSDYSTIDRFGWSVSISGDVAVVGAQAEREDATGGSTIFSAGAAYIFVRDGGGNWNQMQKIVASDRASADVFGTSVSVSGNYIVVGAYQEDEDENGNNTVDRTGSAYIFKYNCTNWQQVQKIVSSHRVLYANFGYSVANSGNYALVGAFGYDEDGIPFNMIGGTGAAYIFETPPCFAPDVPTLSLKWDTICAGGADTIKIALTDSLHSATQWVLYEDSCGGVKLDSNATGRFVVTPTVTTTYYVKGEGGCTAVCQSCTSNSITVTVEVPATLFLGNDTALCLNQTLILNAATPNATAYRWQDNSTAPTYTVTTQGTYWAQATTICGNALDTIVVSYITPFSVNLGNDTTICSNQTITLTATTANATNYLWQNNSTSPIYIVTAGGTYWVEITNACNSIRDSITVKEINCGTSSTSFSELEMPNIFSPNNDGVNELFVPQIESEITNAKIVVYNRWGLRMYESNKLMEGWDGRTNAGISVPEGVYYWVIDYRDNKGQEHHLKGFVTLVR